MTLKEKEMPEEWDRDGGGAAISVENLRDLTIIFLFCPPTVMKQQRKWRKLSCQTGFQIQEERKSVFHDIKLGATECSGNCPDLSLL